jgi:DNA adenine methylase
VSTRLKLSDPLLKWPGGKRSLLSALLSHLPGTFGRYFEPFFGGGALFFAIQPKRALLSDTNADLINCYQMVRDEPTRLVQLLSRWSNDSRTYLKVRAWHPSTRLERAARLMYLTALSFNGIYRVNLRGDFNVPYGRRSHLPTVEPERIKETSEALQRRSIKCLDFEAAVRNAKKGDLVYLDPPYTVAHGDNGFLRYNARIFSWVDQTRLARTVLALSDRGCSVLLTNACHPSIRALYKGLGQIEVKRVSRIAASAGHRGSVSELLITNLAQRL